MNDLNLPSPPAPTVWPTVSLVVAAHDEAWHGTAADSYYEIQVQTDRKAPLPDDRWKRGPRSGRRV